jgi:hypothetical protein
MNIMKRKSKLYILGIIAVFAFSCTDLQEDPVGLLAPEGYFKTEKEVQTAINGCYGSMASSLYYGNGLTTPLQIMSDMVDLGLNFSNYADFATFIHTPTNTFPRDLWGCSYGIIGIANTAVYGVTQIDETEAVKNRLEAEARFVRAFAYYHLVQLFGEIPYLDNVDIVIADVKKSSVSDVYEEIISDLEFAKEHLPMQHPDGDVRTRPSKGTATTVLASVHLTRGNWQAAYDNAKWVIDNASALNYSLEPDFQDLFRAETQDNSKEYIFAVDFKGDVYGGSGVNRFTLENDQTIGAFNSIDGGAKPNQGWSMLVPSLKVYQTWDDDDYRKKVSLTDSIILASDKQLHPYTDFPQIPRPHAAKLERFCGVRKSNTSGWRSDMNYVCFRYAEVLLIAAEAGNEIDKTSEAVGYVNQIRARARAGGNINYEGSGYGSYGPSTSPADVSSGISQGDFRNLVLEERRLELAFEFKRWYDIVRRDLGDQVFGANGLETQPNFNKAKHYLLPIPQTEIDVHPKLAPQNPGY